MTTPPAHHRGLIFIVCSRIADPARVGTAWGLVFYTLFPYNVT